MILCRSPRFYEKIWRWFKRRRCRSLRRGRNSSSSDGQQFPVEKHSNLKHGCVVAEAGRAKLPSVTSLGLPPPARSKLTSTASSASALHPPIRGDTVESGYHSNSPELSSVTSSKSRIFPGSNPRSPVVKMKADRFQFLKRKFHIGHSSLSEEISDPESEFHTIDHDKTWLSRSTEAPQLLEPEADSKRRLFQGRHNTFHAAVTGQDIPDDLVDDESRNCPSAVSNLSSYNSSVFSNSVTSLTRCLQMLPGFKNQITRYNLSFSLNQ